MTLSELTRDQKIELKQHILCDEGDVSYGMLAAADDLVTDEELWQRYGATDFSPDDFDSKKVMDYREAFEQFRSEILCRVAVYEEREKKYTDTIDRIENAQFLHDSIMAVLHDAEEWEIE